MPYKVAFHLGFLTKPFGPIPVDTNAAVATFIGLPLSDADKITPELRGSLWECTMRVIAPFPPAPRKMEMRRNAENIASASLHLMLSARRYNEAQQKDLGTHLQRLVALLDNLNPLERDVFVSAARELYPEIEYGLALWRASEFLPDPIVAWRIGKAMYQVASVREKDCAKWCGTHRNPEPWKHQLLADLALWIHSARKQFGLNLPVDAECKFIRTALDRCLRKALGWTSPDPRILKDAIKDFRAQLDGE